MPGRCLTMPKITEILLVRVAVFYVDGVTTEQLQPLTLPGGVATT